MGTQIIPQTARIGQSPAQSAHVQLNHNRITPTLLKIAAMLVAAPRYVGLMLFLSGFVFNGWFLNALHIAEGVAGLALATLEGFALAYILSRRQLGFSSGDKRAIVAVVGGLLVLLPLCATPYLVSLFDGTQVFATQQNDFALSLLKFCWVAGTASMPILIIIGVALVEKDPVDVQILNAERQALLQQTLARIEAETEQITLQYKLQGKQARTLHKAQEQHLEEEALQNVSKKFVCDTCGAAFETQKGLSGHTGHCKAKTNGKLTIKLAEVLK
jgi:hypothetical protein